MGTLSHIRRQLQTITKSSLISKMFKIAVYIVTTLALAQQIHGLSKCYTGNDGKEVACTTACVKMHAEEAGLPDLKSCDVEGAQSTCQKEPFNGQDNCAMDTVAGVETTVCCCTSDLCNGVGVSGLSGALALALVAAIFWGQRLLPGTWQTTWNHE